MDRSDISVVVVVEVITRDYCKGAPGYEGQVTGLSLSLLAPSLINITIQCGAGLQ